MPPFGLGSRVVCKSELRAARRPKMRQFRHFTVAVVDLSSRLRDITARAREVRVRRAASSEIGR